MKTAPHEEGRGVHDQKFPQVNIGGDRSGRCGAHFCLQMEHQCESPAGLTARGVSGPVDTSKAHDLGARVGEAMAKAANKAEDAIAHGAVTAKIKSKMVLAIS